MYKGLGGGTYATCVLGRGMRWDDSLKTDGDQNVGGASRIVAPPLPQLTALPSQDSTNGEGIGVFILGAGVMPLDLELVVLGHQLQVVVHVMKQRNPARLIIRATAHHAVAVILCFTVGQRQAVLAQFVRALHQVAVAVHITQGGFPGIVGEERVDALGLEAGTGQRQAAHFELARHNPGPWR